MNKITDTIDIGDYLVAGKNEITIDLTMTLCKRTKVESVILAAGGNLSFVGTVVDDYGLRKVILQPYLYTKIAEEK